MQTVHSVYLILEWALELLFYCYCSIHQGWLAREVYILPLYLSPENWPDSSFSLFFFYRCLLKLVSWSYTTKLSVGELYLLIQFVGFSWEKQSCRGKIIKRKGENINTKDCFCSQNSSIGFLSCVFYNSSLQRRSQWADCWVEMMWRIIQGQNLWLLHSENIDGVHDSCHRQQYHQ